MTAAKIEYVKMLALAMPVLVLLVALLVVRLTGLQDAREDRRRLAREAGTSPTAVE
jgi:hypothetical protein